ncbi:MAG TPA: DUF6445 family protein [Hypericibacter adhaerens]|jgi:hypothetical protein|uniref:DUF6445 family protein n=1 Tax=Hypericibacter adhaerens TaxID=2602016 RepID=UPI002BBB8D34|nr:DUF6445 family protein [Hypericibacter adhaerens]HWA44657.1 DUF6445 family protein [Hypericibacter adhaerens]
MRKSLIVLDDVYTDPADMRQAALRLDYPLPTGPANYAGRNSTSKLLAEGSDRMFSWATGERLAGATDRAHGALRLTLPGDQGRYRVHVDAGVEWSGVLYLNEPSQCQGGTSFFRHRPTGTDKAPTTDEELARCDGGTAGEALDRILGEDSNDMTKWDLLQTVPMRFNRLVLFRPWLWHSAGEGFGSSLADGRLVQLFFLRTARAA